MANKLYEESAIQDIADAIRSKNGSSDTYTVSEMSTAIENIPSGGGGSDYFVSEITDTNIKKAIKKLPPLKITYSGTMLGAFQNCTNLQEVEQLNIPGITDARDFFAGCTNLSSVNLTTSSSLTNTVRMFQNCSSLQTVPQFITSGITYFNYMFDHCSNLENVPQLDFSSATSLENMFVSCEKMTDTSINNILLSCISATSYTGTKKLSTLGFSRWVATSSRIQSMPNYQDFVDAGWTIGY